MKVAVMSFAHVHAAGYTGLLLNTPGVEVRACDPGPYVPGELRGRAMADELGVTYVDTYEELLAWKPDAVVITSENAMHRHDVELAAQAGAHILCEKPLATTWEDGVAIRDAVAKAGVMLMVAFPVRFASAFQKLKAQHEAGALGKVFAIRGANNGTLPSGRAWFTEPELSGGGALVDHIVHVADMVEDLTHLAPVRVNAAANTVLYRSQAKAETAGLTTIVYENGLIVGIDCSWSEPQASPVWGGLKLTVIGTGGNVSIDFFGAAASGIDSVTGKPIVTRYGPNFDVPMLSTFLDAVRTGKQPQPSVDVGLRTLSIVLAAQESVRTGQTVDIASITG